MALFDLETDQNVAVVTMNSGENLFNLEYLKGFHAILDEVEKNKDINALVVTSGHEKIFCNGIDVNWLMPVIGQNDTKTALEFFYTMEKLFKRIMLFPMPTIAAISGHAIGSGAVLICAFDFRFMRSDRGFVRFPEVDLGIVIFPAALKMVLKAVPLHKFSEFHLTGKRIDADEMVASGVALKACHANDLLNEAVAYAKGLNKRREVVGEIKLSLYKDIIHSFDIEDPPVIEAGKYYR